VISSADLAVSKTDLLDPVMAAATPRTNHLTKPLQLHLLRAAFAKWLPRDAADTVVGDLPEPSEATERASALNVGVLKEAILSRAYLPGFDAARELAARDEYCDVKCAAPCPCDAAQPVPPIASAELRIEKSDGVASVVAGTYTTYTITLTNDGPSTVPAGVVITDAIPAATNGSSGSAGCVIAAGTFTCTTSALASGASVSFQLTLGIPADYALPSVSNTATIGSSPIVDPNPANDSATDVDTVATSADLAITKTDAVDPVVLGDNVVYTITVTNNGPSDAAGVDVTDALPGFTTFVSATPSQGLLAGRRHRHVSAGCHARRERRDDHRRRGDHGRRRHHQPGDGDGDHARPVPGNNDASQDTTVASWADLAIAKTDGVLVVVAGTSTAYTVTLTNNGPSVEPAGVVVSDPIPAGTTGSESELDCSIGAARSRARRRRPRRRHVDHVPAHAGGRLRVRPPALTNTASIISTPIVDPDASNDAATDVDTVTASADLSINKTDGVTAVKPGTSTTFTITVANNGPSDVPRGDRGHRPAPGRHGRLRERGELHADRDHVHVHDDGRAGGGRLGRLPPDAGDRSRIRVGDPCQHGRDHRVAGTRPEPCERHVERRRHGPAARRRPVDRQDRLGGPGDAGRRVLVHDRRHERRPRRRP
jgi:uncharacterized repeat protein (TIGR01451 family)